MNIFEQGYFLGCSSIEYSYPNVSVSFINEQYDSA